MIYPSMKALSVLLALSALSVIGLLPRSATAQVSVGYYDENMVFHYGNAPSTSSYSGGSSNYSYQPPAASSYYQGGYSGPSVFDTMFDDFMKGLDDWNQQMAKRQEDHKRKRERWNQEAAKRWAALKTRKSPRTNLFHTSKPKLKTTGLDRTGADWFPLLFDLKPRAVASSTRSGDNYYRKGEWDKAIRSYKSALRIDPDNKSAQRKLDAAMAKKKNAKKSHPEKASHLKLFGKH